MAGIDNMLSQYIRTALESQLGKRATSKIEQQLDLWYQIDLDEAVTKFEKLDRILTDIYGRNPARSLEKRFLRSIIDTKNIRVNGNNNNDVTTKIAITEPQLVKIILSTVGDESFRRIFDAMNGNETGILEILRMAKLDLSDKTKYRKMDELIESGLIVQAGYAMGNAGRRVKTYKKIFESMDVVLDDDAVRVTMTVDNESMLQKSLVINTVLGV